MISRVPRSRQQAKSTYNRLSGWYDWLEGLWERKPKALGLQKVRVREGERVLEIGFGTGHGLVALAKSVGDSGKVYGIDISQGMLNVAKARMDKTGLSGRVHLILGDATNLPFAAGSFDAVFMSFVLELFDTPDIPKVLQECRRVLQPEGRTCIVALSKEGKPALMRDLYEWGHEKFPSLLDCRPIFVQAALEGEGFQILEASQVPICGLPVEVVVARKSSQTEIV